jgi:hypothetical protein
MQVTFINKALSVALAIIGSVWFMPVSWLALASAWNWSACKPDAHAAWSAVKHLMSFTVLIEREKGEHPEAVLLSEVRDFFAMHPDATLLLSGRTGKTADLAWEYQAESHSPDQQRIRVEYLDSHSMRFTYSASARTVQPLVSEVVSVAHWCWVCLWGCFLHLSFVGQSGEFVAGKKR